MMLVKDFNPPASSDFGNKLSYLSRVKPSKFYDRRDDDSRLSG